MSLILLGKGLETLGAILLAYVGIRAAVLELLVGRYLHTKNVADPVKASTASGGVPSAARPADGCQAPPPGQTGLEGLRADLETVLQRRQKQFGFYEIILVAIGTALIAIGCVLYLLGLVGEPH